MKQNYFNILFLYANSICAKNDDLAEREGRWTSLKQPPVHHYIFFHTKIIALHLQLKFNFILMLSEMEALNKIWEISPFHCLSYKNWKLGWKLGPNWKHGYFLQKSLLLHFSWTISMLKLSLNYSLVL